MSLRRIERMVCFEDDVERFQMRAAGIALREGQILLHRVAGERFWILPGGRVEQSEASDETLAREMIEELGTEVEIGPLAFVLESFFSATGRQFHEIGLYYRMGVPESFPFTPGAICRSVQEGEVTLEFMWAPATAEGLRAAGLQPQVLWPHLAEPPAKVLHLVDRDGPDR